MEDKYIPCLVCGGKGGIGKYEYYTDCLYCNGFGFVEKDTKVLNMDNSFSEYKNIIADTLSPIASVTVIEEDGLLKIYASPKRVQMWTDFLRTALRYSYHHESLTLDVCKTFHYSYELSFYGNWILTIKAHSNADMDGFVYLAKLFMETNEKSRE